jgi:phage shock protein A
MDGPAPPTATGKRFKIIVIPTVDLGFGNYCFQYIGQGASFCTARNCATAHHHAAEKAVIPGDIYVAKGVTTAFVTPSLTASALDPHVLSEWKSLSLGLPEWNEKFLIAAAISDDLPASAAAIEVQETFFRNKALNFKTPGKRKRGQDEQGDDLPDLLELSPYSKFFKQDEVAPITEVAHVVGVLARLDQGVASNNDTIINFVEDYRSEHLKAGDAITALWLRLEALAASVGVCPTRLAHDYLAPSAWGSIGAMAAKLDNFERRIQNQATVTTTHKREFLNNMTELQVDVESKIISEIKVSRDEFFQRFESFKLAFISATRGLGGRMDNVEIQLMGMVSKLGHTGSTLTHVPGPVMSPQDTDRLSRDASNVDTNDLANEVIKRIETRMVDMENRLSGLVSKGDDRAIKFAGLGFQSISQSNAWLETELRRHPSGLIVDVHMVLEHIHYALEGIDTIATMEKLYKIKVTCIADSVAITSFDTKTPKFFCKIQGHKVLKGDASYLDAIPTQSDWADVGTGFKMRLQEALMEFQESHGTFVDQAVEIGSKPHTLAHAALTESVAWIIGFIQFVDEYYRELSKAKFGAGKAWHVTTRLAKRILDEVGTQRYGVQNAFQVGDSRQICQQILWAVLKSHDVMQEYKRLNFKNHPSIATELVKFLAINTSFEAIEKLTTQVASHQVEIVEYRKNIAALTKTCMAATNKSDEAKKLLDQLSKRVEKVEKK